MPRPLKVKKLPPGVVDTWQLCGPAASAPRSKYNACRTEVDGVVFASKKEAGRYSELRLLEKAGKISGLRLQPRLALVVKGMKVCTYVGDFEYRVGKGRAARTVVEDVKGRRTDVYRLKKKLVKALLGIDIQEV